MGSQHHNLSLLPLVVLTAVLVHGAAADCTDKRTTEQCRYWRSQNYCSSASNWYDYMGRNCMKTCGKCSTGAGGQVIRPTLQWTEWNQWTACSVSCGAGVMKRTRECKKEGLGIVANLECGGWRDATWDVPCIIPCEECWDNHESCSYWQGEGYCLPSSRYFRGTIKFCPKSCNVCTGSGLRPGTCKIRAPYYCDDGECTQHHVGRYGNQICDGVKQCRDGSDEMGCTDHCPYYKPFRCQNETKCISNHYRCDGFMNCADGSDEFNCSDRCPADRPFRCQSETKCISSSLRCDGYSNCVDGSDEFNCTGICRTRKYSYECDDGECIYISGHCDGVKQCRDGSDEMYCIDQCPVNRPFRCQNETRCIINSFRCDGKRNCADRSDEFNCKGICDTRPNTYECDDGECIGDNDSGSPLYGRKQCDGVKQCRDGSDEMYCTDKCRPAYRPFRCHNTTKCITNSRRCDGYNHCADGSDEFNCTDQCPAERPFRCQSQTRCIGSDRRCDGYAHCADQSDEWLNCTGQWWVVEVSTANEDRHIGLDELQIQLVGTNGSSDWVTLGYWEQYAHGVDVRRTRHMFKTESVGEFLFARLRLVGDYEWKCQYVLVEPTVQRRKGFQCGWLRKNETKQLPWQ